ncbi:MAG: hypothetical protein CML46_08415 [Rhodobacteraceae bacterium]|nr:hypothetical protein [Paracoccaceae bacterium]MBR26949.1 hypothetical protein [Paracoccaceae bacterium]
MQDFPKPDAVLGAVIDWLRDVAVPNLPPHAAFEAKVAANALGLVARALDAGPAETAEHARLTALLGRDGGIEDLTAALSERIRSGEIDLATPGLADHLWTTTLDKLAVDQPKFAPYRRVRTAETQEG